MIRGKKGHGLVWAWPLVLSEGQIFPQYMGQAHIE